MPTLTPTIVFPIFDDFNDPQYDGSFNQELWDPYKTDSSYSLQQQDGAMVLGCNHIAGAGDVGIHLLPANGLILNKPYYSQANFMVDVSAYGASLGFNFYLLDGFAACTIQTWDWDTILCWIDFLGEYQELPTMDITPGTWHTIRIELIDPAPVVFNFYINEQFIGSLQPRNAGDTRSISSIWVHMVPGTEKWSQGYIDDFSFGPLDIP